ncbi:hypothetical protein QL285_039310 [Trifolium repens]|nr:hypothetical protein QL285_039310 [Trifolium repens]
MSWRRYPSSFQNYSRSRQDWCCRNTSGTNALGISGLKKCQDSGVLGTSLNFQAIARGKLSSSKSNGHGSHPNDESSSMKIS